MNLSYILGMCIIMSKSNADGIVSLSHCKCGHKKRPRQERILSGNTWGKSEYSGEFLSEEIYF